MDLHSTTPPIDNTAAAPRRAVLYMQVGVYLYAVLPVCEWRAGELPVSVAALTFGRAAVLLAVAVVAYIGFVAMQAASG